MTASFQFNSSSLFTINQSFDAIHFQLLTASLNKPHVSKEIHLESKTRQMTVSLFSYIMTLSLPQTT
jgi:hypothetical protein